jgi:hypothetical protein
VRILLAISNDLVLNNEPSRFLDDNLRGATISETPIYLTPVYALARLPKGAHERGLLLRALVGSRKDMLKPGASTLGLPCDELVSTL